MNEAAACPFLLCDETAYLLLGGDKSGDGRWYEVHVPKAEAIYAEHLKELKKAP